MLAQIIVHPSSGIQLEPVPPDPRDPPVVDRHQPPTDEEWAQLEAVEVIRIIGQKYGYARVGAWVRSLATIAGQDINQETAQ